MTIYVVLFVDLFFIFTNELFTYLLDWSLIRMSLTTSGILISSMNDFKIRRAAAWSAVKKLSSIWKLIAISNHLKILRLFNNLVISILLYNATTWTMNKTLATQVTLVGTMFLIKGC